MKKILRDFIVISVSAFSLLALFALLNLCTKN